MATKQGIYDGALGKIGVEKSTPGSTQELTLDSQWETAVKATLEAYGWRFATKRAELSVDSASPEFEFANQFPVPSDCIRVLGVWDGSEYTDVGWEEGDGYILTDEEELYIKYTYNQTDISKFSAMFCEALEFKLASLVAMPLRENKTLAELTEARFEKAILRAETQDAKKRSRRTTGRKSSWTNGRKSSTIEPGRVV